MRQLRRICTAIVVLLGAVLIVPAFGGTASAHHSNIEASADCTGTVSWKATSWATGPSGTNPDIRVFKQIGAAAPVQIGSGAFNDANNYQFGGTFTWPTGVNSMIISSQPFGVWGNGMVSTTGSSVTIYKPSNCPNQPGVTQAVSCINNTSPGNGEGKIIVTLTNAAGPYGSPVTFKVYNVDQTTGGTNYTVVSGGSTPVTFTGIADGQHFVKISAVGPPAIDKTQNFTVDCDQPMPAVTNSATCANGDGQVVATLTNTGGEPVVFDVTNPTTSVVEHVTVNANSSTTRTFSGFADGTHTIVVKVGATNYSQTFTVDCDHPAPGASSTVLCSNNDGTVTITLTNTGTEGVVFHVTNPITQVVEDVTVGAGGSVPVSYGGFNDGTYTVTIAADGKDYSQTFSVSCDVTTPSAAFTQTCIDGENGISNGQVVVTLTNNGDDLDMVFTVNGVPTTVGPLQSATVTLSGLPDGPASVEVFSGALRLGFDAVLIACDQPGLGTISTASACADSDGQVTVTLIATGGELPVVFTVQGVTYSVLPNTQTNVVISGLPDGATPIAVFAGQKDLSFIATTNCDMAPTHSYIQACADYDDTVTVLIGNPGDDVDVTFVINGTTYTLNPGESLSVPVGPLADGINTITLTINGVPQDDIVVTSDCNPTFGVTAVCNSGSGEGTLHWFTITNTESTDVTVTWNGGSATMQAGQSTTISTMSSSLVLLHNGQQIAQAGASETNCERTVIVTKELLGAPATGETYTMRISRLVGSTYVEETTFTLGAGESKVIHLPSTMDPAGIDYKFEEIVAGTANTSVVSPNQLTLSGNLGETVSVVVTNGYASVQIDKASFTPTVVPGGQITYTLQATNTGGLTLNPVVITDRLASTIELVSASVAGGAGQCELTETTRPQLLTCTMSDALAPGATTSVITLVVEVDSTVVSGTQILNQAMVHGAYAAGAVLSGIGAGGPTLSCVPVIASTVCDLSAQVSVPVSTPIVASSPPVSSVSVAVPELPRTGADHLNEMLVFAFGGILLGGALLLGRRGAR